MAGIVFLKTANLGGVVEFYTSQIGMEIWLKQPECTLLKHGNLVLGFLAGPEPDLSGVITFYYPTREDVDRMYEKHKGTAESPPKVNEKYRIYNFFARDPEGRRTEFQAFLHPVTMLPGGDDLLLTRRSIRQFTDQDVSREVLDTLMELCRTSPTSRHSQSYYFVVVRNADIKGKLAAIREGASSPIGRAPVAVAICSDPAKTKRISVDGDIAAYHLILAAWSLGLGTCWIGGMDRSEVKELLGIPQDHYVATVTGLGYPAERPSPKERRPAKELYRIV
jgi:nitroreductase